MLPSSFQLTAVEIRIPRELQAAVHVRACGTLPDTEFKAKRIRDGRKKLSNAASASSLFISAVYP
jgi:hypothetical protein